MDNLFLKRVNSWQGSVKKEQESIFEKSIDSLCNLQFIWRYDFGMRLFFLWSSLLATPQQERSLSHSNSTRFKKRSAIPLRFKDLVKKLSDPQTFFAQLYFSFNYIIDNAMDTIRNFLVLWNKSISLVFAFSFDSTRKSFRINLIIPEAAMFSTA